LRLRFSRFGRSVELHSRNHLTQKYTRGPEEVMEKA
jgi:hypothetical protein